ncbi:MAG: hypothetical protein USCAAHI_00092 [Beijerinckiaceae bacterium]|nr:MAG: hypothetical protein USCAAHI_00092 [Beijerinckiaceae bacterium]
MPTLFKPLKHDHAHKHRRLTLLRLPGLSDCHSLSIRRTDGH